MTGISLDRTIDALHDTLARTARRAELAASNLVNIDTPGYRAQEIEFEEAVSAGSALAMGRTHSGHLSVSGDSRAPGRVVEKASARIRNDGNSVDIDREMTELAMSSGRYRTAAEIIRKRFALLIYAATDGRA